MQSLSILGWAWSNLAPLTNSAGLVLDIIGAFFVASEVVKQYRGSKLVSTPGWVQGAEIVAESPEYQEWEEQKYRNMKWGLASLAGGFVLQILSNWIK